MTDGGDWTAGPPPPSVPPRPAPPPPPPRRPRRGPNWLLWGFVFAASTALLFIAFVLALIGGMSAELPTIGSGTTLTIDLARPYPEDRLYDVSSPFLQASDVTFRDLLFAIEAAKTDDRVSGLMLRVRGTSLGWANVYELRSKLEDFKSSQKPVTAFVEYASNRDYVIATAADSLYLHPRGSIDLRGIRAELLYLRTALEKAGIEAEFERFGEYKDAPDMFLRDDMSATSEEALSAIVSTLHDSLVEGIADGRSRDEATVDGWLADGPFTATEAADAGLVDELRYLDETREDGAEPAREASVQEYWSARTPSGFGTQGRIALVYGLGAIASGSSGEDAIYGQVMGSDTLAKAFATVRADDDIDAVVFRIDSPGGSDIASDVIWREAHLTALKKPVVVSMGNVAASGGYWIAMASNTVVAAPTTITGSIGIYAGKFNLGGLYEKLGVGRDGVSSKPNAEFYSDSRAFTEEERARFRAMLREGYDAFLERVAEARGKSTEEVDAVARGRVWSGRMAKEVGLVDELGGLERAIELAKEQAGYGASDRFELVVYPEKKSVFEALLGNFLSARARADDALVALDPRKLLERSPILASLARGERLAILPFELVLR